MKHAIAIVDLQYGSTGKGQIAGTIARDWQPDTVVTAWGPNAGHTFRDGDLKFVSRMIATCAIIPSVDRILVGPGSVVDLEIMAEEIKERGRQHLGGKTLIIHPQAAVLNWQDALSEQAHLLRIGSTMKGTAEAHVRKIRRENTGTANGRFQDVVEHLAKVGHEAGVSVVMSSYQYDRAVDGSRKMIIEGAQGFSLGYHTDFYPYCTGRDVSTAQLLADCRIPFPGDSNKIHVLGVCRTFPIRVANRRDSETGNIVGHSGGCYDDQHELKWADIGQEPELTTVTKLPRRLFSFSDEQIRQAIRICQPRTIALTFADYLQQDKVVEFINRVEAAGNVPVRVVSTGPDRADVKWFDRVRGELGPLRDGSIDWESTYVYD